MRHDVVIVGAGVAGLYAGWSLLRRGAPVPGGRGGPPRVLILEASPRVGGRIETLLPPGAPHLRAEIGAMRFWSSDRLTAALVDHLGLETAPFTGEGGDPHDVYFLRGSRFTVQDLVAGDGEVPYDLPDAERGQTLMQLAMRDMAAAMPALMAAGGAERRALGETLAVGGVPVRDCSMHDLFAAAVSPEGTELLLDGLGFDYGRDPRVGAANVLQMDVDPRVDELRTVPAGMQSLTDSLAQAVRALGGEIRTGARAVAVDEGEGGRPRVRLADGGAAEGAHVVLALPRRALELMDRSSGPLAGSRIDDLLDTVVPIPAGKLVLLFDEAWWEALGIRGGGSITDLPIRRCVYLGVEHPAGDGRRAGLLIASYADSAAFAHFRLLDEGPRDPSGAEPYAPSRAMVATAIRDLGLMHGVEVPEPRWSVFRDWTVDPYGAGYHYWTVGTVSREVIPAMRRPAPGAPVYVCGEAFSAHQGWIDGALLAAERVLRDHLGQPAPDWIPADLDLGP